MPFFAVVLLIVLFELEEDWRGAHELAAAKARWASAGYSLEAADYVPPPVPDDKNLAALPIFKLEPDAEENGKLTDVPLHAAVDEDKHGGSLTDSRKKKDLAELVAAAYTKMFPGKTAPASALSQLEELYPVIADLRTAAPTHPEFRLNIDYTSEPAFSRPLGPVVRQIAVAKLLANHAQLALAENQPQVALEDIRINFQIARGVATHPTLVGGLVSVGVAAITEREVVDGLTRHAWNDAQLAQLQDTLKQLDYLADYQFVMRGEVAMFFAAHVCVVKKSAIEPEVDCGHDGRTIECAGICGAPPHGSASAFVVEWMVGHQRSAHGRLHVGCCERCGPQGAAQ